MSLTLTTADSALKEFYLPEAREQLNQEDKFLSQIEQTSQDVEGRRAVLSLHVSRNTAVGARAEGATLPTAGNQGYAEQRVPLFYNYGRIKLTGPTIRAMKSDQGSFVRAVDSESKGVISDLRHDVSRQCWNDSTKTIAKCGVTSAAAEVVLASDTPDNIMRFFEVGMLVDIGTAADTDSLIVGEAITAINRTTKTITVSTSITTTAANFVSRQGADRQEITGVRNIVNATDTLHNIAPGTYDVWKSTVNSNSGTNRAVTDILMETVVDDVEQESGYSPTIAYGARGVRRAIGALYQSQKRYANTQELKGGFKALSLDVGDTEVPFMADRFVPNNRIFFLNMGHLKHHQMSDWEFMDEDGAVLDRVSGEDAYEAVLFKYSENTTDNRRAHGVLEDITEA